MVLKFYANNYKSFRDSLEFSMEPSPNVSGMEYSILTNKIDGIRRSFKALSSAVIYGPNASGKTNIIGAMDTMRSIVLRGNIRDVDEPSDVNSPNMASRKLALIPFMNVPDKPVQLGIAFICDNLHIEYSFTMDLGNFLQDDYKRSITQETLLINGREIFSRGSTLSLSGLKHIRTFLNGQAVMPSESLIKVAENGLLPTELFLTNGFKNIYSNKLSMVITEWFANKLMVVYHADRIMYSKQISNPREDTVYILNNINSAAKTIGINSSALGFVQSGTEGETVLCSCFGDGRGRVIPAEYFESYGTVRFINEFPLIIRALKTGAVLAVDELDASIHPMALMNLINIFHNDDINVNHAQLIFNTHNPIFLSAGIYRRDEIKFVEKDDSTHVSSHYSLSDFKKFGRKTEDYLKNYFVGRYGAIKELDFSPLLKEIITPLDVEGAIDG